MTKQEQIEEIKEAVIASAIVANAKIDSSCAVNLTGFAEHMYKIGYRKIPENAVVLTEEEYIDLSRKYVGEQIEMARKETAKEFANELKARSFPEDGIGWDCVYVKDIDAVLKEYGVEVEEK